MQADQLAAIARTLADGSPSLTELRAAFPGVSFTRLELADVRDETPAGRAGPWTLFLLDGRQHCMALTQDLDAATGVVLAR